MQRLAVVTGAAGGIGHAIVEAFHDSGWSVIGLDLAPSADLSEAAEMVEMDVSSADQVASFFQNLQASGRALHALVNNAAVLLVHPLPNMEPDQWDHVMAANLRSVFLMSRGAYPLLKATRGSIVNVSSVHAIATSKHVAAYAASKGGIMALTRAMAIEFGAEGMRVNAVLPGAVDTRMLHEGLSRGDQRAADAQAALEELARKTVLGRIGDPNEIARAILFLADPAQASFITGQGLVVDGGATARLSTE